ncbi:hypothetical protein ACLOJK_006012 [Asimina triloba]
MNTVVFLCLAARGHKNYAKGARDGAEDDLGVLIVEQPQVVLVEGLLLFNAPTFFAKEETIERQLGGGVWLFSGCPTLNREVVGAYPLSIRFPSMLRGAFEKKETFSESREGKGLVVPDDEEERLARREKADLQAGLTLSHKEARCLGLVVVSPEAAVEPVHLRSSSLPILVIDLNEGALSPAPSSEKEPSGTPVQTTLEGAEVRVVADQGLAPRCRANQE